MQRFATRTLALLVVLLSIGAGSEKPPVGLFAGPVEPKPQNGVDELVFRRWRAAGLKPALLCTDAVFLRRAYLDVIGTLPTAEEARRFLKDPAPGKRAALVESLLAREEFADLWAMKWSDLLRVKAEFPINLWPNAAAAYHGWIRASIRENKPYDRFARELLTASGSNFRVPQVNFWRAAQSKDPRSLAQAVALTFLGARAEKWEVRRLEGMAAFFSRVGYKSTQEWKEEIVFFDSVKAAADAASGPSATAAAPAFPDGTPAKLSPDRDPREVFADWLLAPRNPWLARAAANRVWYWLMGRGIVHEPDDIRPDNPPRNPELLAFLERELVAAKYDLKRLFRLILNSHAYQLSSVPRTPSPDAEAECAVHAVRRLDAEVLIDALCQVTGTTEKYSSLIPEPFTIVPEGVRAIALPDGSITSPFLEMFGRPPRDTGLESERSGALTATQRLHLLNSSHIREKIERSKKLRAIFATPGRNPREAATELYLAVLSRFPTDEELEVAREYSRSSGVKGPDAVIDLTWALLNSSEFLYRH